MFGTYGEITFEVLGSPVQFESSYRWTYAEHDVVEARPRLQWLSENLRTIEFDLLFHASFTNPTAQLESLLAAARDHSARPLVLGNGDHQGYFVIVALRMVSTQMTAFGDVVAMKVHLELKEWALASELDPTVPPQPGFAPIAIVPAPEGTDTAPVTYSGAVGLTTTNAPTSAKYIATLTGAPGVSSILADPAPRGLPTTLAPDDVPASAIVRSAAG
jgi:phage protein U